MTYIKSRNVMYVQQLKYFKETNLQEIIERITTKLEPKKYAGIIHDKDLNKEGELISPHLHLVMEFKNARSLNSLAKHIDDKPQSFEKWAGSVNNAYSYLIHQTNDSLELHQYDVKEVIANFDYVQLIDDISKNVEVYQRVNDTHVINNILDLLYEGNISKGEAEENLTGSQYAKAKTKIDAVHQKYLEMKANEWRKNKLLHGESITIIWLYGQAGTGKTRLAKKYAETLGSKYFMSGSSRDPFQKYNSESIVILDELRPSLFDYSDLLKMLDPFNEGAMAASRYFDKPLTADYFIITSPYCPRKFYDELSFTHHLNTLIDHFNQLLRRISIVQRLTNTEIYLNSYSMHSHEFKDEVTSSIRNLFSGQQMDENNRKESELNLFNKLNNFDNESSVENE